KRTSISTMASTNDCGTTFNRPMRPARCRKLRVATRPCTICWSGCGCPREGADRRPVIAAHRPISLQEGKVMNDTNRTTEFVSLQPKDSHNESLQANVHPPDWVNPTTAERYNLVVIGAGTAGLVT